MTISRIVPNAATADIAANHAFYAEFLGMDIVMAMGWIVTYASPANPTAQVSLITADATAPVVADISIEVENVDILFDLAILRGERIVYPLTDEPWGVRRFFVEDPNGRIVNIVQHRGE
jgi:catechol 2,3-dioxygenase-like lactoylglutathione lyase family enzyme